jgi:hypothetical protein
MEWYDWVFAICGATTAFGVAAMMAEIYTDVRERASHRTELRRRHRGR